LLVSHTPAPALRKRSILDQKSRMPGTKTVAQRKLPIWRARRKNSVSDEAAISISEEHKLLAECHAT
jgi:hypothetical protein